jgi:uncharacterized protein
MPQIPAWQIIFGGVPYRGNLLTQAEHVYYAESLSGKASSLEIALQDSPSTAWENNPPTVGQVVSLSIGYQGAALVSCGNFEVDEWEFNGPPSIFMLRAIQAGMTQALRTVRSIAYEGQSLTQIASSVAARYGMTVVADAVSPNVIYQRLTQKLETDLAFLHRIANLHNYEFTIRGNQLVFYSRPQLESQPPPGSSIDITDTVRFRIHKQHVGDPSYASVYTMYFDPLSKALVTAQATDPNSLSQDALKIVERMENQQQATLRAQSHLHAANMGQIKADVTLPGTMLYRAGNTVNLSGFGDFDSVKFIVNEAKHRLSASGYITPASRSAASPAVPSG